MPELFIVSDSHGATGFLRRAADRILDGDYAQIIHLGDVLPDADRLSEWIGRPVVSVTGNCDFLSRAARERTLSLAEQKILLTHGDRFRVKSSLDALSYRAEEAGCKCALYGHTHMPFAGLVGSVLLVNPGALCDGRYATLRVSLQGVVPKLLRIK